MEQARTGRPRLVCSDECRKLRRRVDREEDCVICGKPLEQAATGRARKTCSDRCRQKKRRRNYRTWIDPREHQKTLRRAEREVQRLEKEFGGEGSLDIPTPGYEWLTLRKRLLIRFQRGEGVPFCQICGLPYINDVKRRRPTCKGECSRKWLARMKRVHSGIVWHRGKYDPRVDYRMMMHFAVEGCRHCGKPFCLYHPKQIYCSEKCNKNAWYARHPKHKCAECGEVFRGKQATCSTRCQKKYDYHHKTHCARCECVIKPGCEILPNADTRLPKHRRKSRWDNRAVVFCSGKCRDALGWSPQYKFCGQCGGLYWPEARNMQHKQKFCGKTCKARARRRAEYAMEPLRVCKGCGEAFKRAFGSKSPYCTDECRATTRLARKRELDRERRRAKRSLGILVRMPERVAERMLEAVGD